MSDMTQLEATHAAEIETHDTEPPESEDTVPSSRLPGHASLPEISAFPRSAWEHILGRLTGIEAHLAALARPKWLDEILVPVRECTDQMIALVTRIEVLEDFQRKRRYACRDCPRWSEVASPDLTDADEG